MYWVKGMTQIGLRGMGTSKSKDFKDAKRDKDYAQELISGGGKLQVPCLRIEKSPEDVEWMYESKDIIKFLTKELEL